jgi:hypothetical protein
MVAAAHKVAKKMETDYTFTPFRVLYEAPAESKERMERIKRPKGLVLIEWLDACGSGGNAGKSWVLTLWKNRQHYDESRTQLEEELTLSNPQCTFLRAWKGCHDHWYSRIKWSQAFSYTAGLIGTFLALVAYGKQLGAVPAADLKHPAQYHVFQRDASSKFNLELYNLSSTELSTTFQSAKLEPKSIKGTSTKAIPQLRVCPILRTNEGGKSEFQIECDGLLPEGEYDLQLQGQIKAGYLVWSTPLKTGPISVISHPIWKELKEERQPNHPPQGGVWVSCGLITGKAFPYLMCEASLESDAAAIKNVSMEGYSGTANAQGTFSKVVWQSCPLKPFERYTFNIYMASQPGKAPDWKIEADKLNIVFDDMEGVNR